MKHFLLVFAIAAGISIHAQNVGVGTASPAAKLDVTSTNSGVLIPRIALSGSTDVTTVPSPSTSTLIYNTATVTGTNAISPGYYYWNGSLWNRVLDKASAAKDTSIYNMDGTLSGSRTVTMGADNLTFSATNGNLIYNATGTGYMGIGTASPLAPLHLSALGTTTLSSGLVDFLQPSLAAGSATYLKLGQSLTNEDEADISFNYVGAGSTSNYLGIGFYNTSAVFNVLANGKVGIGTTAPSQTLHVYTTTNGGGIVVDAPTSPSTSPGLLLAQAGTALASVGLAAGNGAFSTDALTNDLVIRTQGTTPGRILLNTTGGTSASSLTVNGSYVGIGTTTPAGPIDVYVALNSTNVLRNYFRNTGTTSGERSDIDIQTRNTTIRDMYLGVADGTGGLGGYSTGGGAYIDNETGGPLFFQNSSQKNVVGIYVGGTPSGLDAGCMMSITNPSATQTLEIIPGYNQNTANSGYTTLDMPGTQTLVVWDNFLATGSVTGTGNYVNSDARIKNVVGYSDNAADLARLQDIRITDYRYRDTENHDRRINKKVIAQQVREVYPEAVVQASGPQYIPNIYLKSTHYSYDEKSNTISIPLTHKLPAEKEIAAGSKCELVAFSTGGKDSKYLNGTIVSLGPDHISVQMADKFACSSYADSIVVFGTQVNDFLSVDYDAISMLNVSATQELSRQLADEKKKNQSLQEQIDILKQHGAKTDDTMEKMKASIETLQQIVETKAQKQ